MQKKQIDFSFLLESPFPQILLPLSISLNNHSNSSGLSSPEATLHFVQWNLKPSTSGTTSFWPKGAPTYLIKVSTSRKPSLKLLHLYRKTSGSRTPRTQRPQDTFLISQQRIAERLLEAKDLNPFHAELCELEAVKGTKPESNGTIAENKHWRPPSKLIALWQSCSVATSKTMAIYLNTTKKHSVQKKKRKIPTIQYNIEQCEKLRK